MSRILPISEEEYKSIRYEDAYESYQAELRASRIEGEVLGRKENKKETAAKMKKDNMAVELIMKYTGLTKDEIEKL